MPITIQLPEVIFSKDEDAKLVVGLTELLIEVNGGDRKSLYAQTPGCGRLSATGFMPIPAAAIGEDYLERAVVLMGGGRRRGLSQQ